MIRLWNACLALCAVILLVIAVAVTPSYAMVDDGGPGSGGDPDVGETDMGDGAEAGDEGDTDTDSDSDTDTDTGSEGNEPQGE